MEISEREAMRFLVGGEGKSGQPFNSYLVHLVSTSEAKMMLGYSSMDMVRRYLALAQADLDRCHQLATSLDNWRL
jgi:hypothetical protein